MCPVECGGSDLGEGVPAAGAVVAISASVASISRRAGDLSG